MIFFPFLPIHLPRSRVFSTLTEIGFENIVGKNIKVLVISILLLTQCILLLQKQIRLFEPTIINMSSAKAFNMFCLFSFRLVEIVQWPTK